ncbi:MAG: hypothetical protein ACRC62_17135 [Microcoleus sp.]
MHKFQAGDRVQAQLGRPGDRYWADGRIKAVSVTGNSCVFEGFDRAGFPISIGVDVENLRAIGENSKISPK